MKKTIFFVLFLASSLLARINTSHAAATCDQYPGDTWIYGGMTSLVKPNVLIIIDTSGSMDDSISTTYDPATTYDQAPACWLSTGISTTCLSNRVYVKSVTNSGNVFYTDSGFSLNNVTEKCTNNHPNSSLSSDGFYIGTLTTTGACEPRGFIKDSTYVMGNWINWNEQYAKISIARKVVKDLISDPRNKGVNFGLMIYNNGDGIDKKQSKGARFFSDIIAGQEYVTVIKDMDAAFNAALTNRDALLASINRTTITASGWTPLAESLYEAGQYFKGATSAFGNTIGLDSSSKYTSPITASCQTNFIIFVTDGMSTSDDSTVLTTVCPPERPDCEGDYDNDGIEYVDRVGTMQRFKHSMDDVAKYLYDTDLLPDDSTVGQEHTKGKQHVSTFTIGFDLKSTKDEEQAAIDLLKLVSDNSHGHGASYMAGNQAELSTALNKILSHITSADTSYVTPVVPTNATNRTYSSDRIYMGLFKPVNESFWKGNLKKYGLGTKTNTSKTDISNVIMDKNKNVAVWMDLDGDNTDDFSGTKLPVGVSSGTFKTDSISFWSTASDGGIVDKGGAGGQLAGMDLTKRVIYTYTTSRIPLANVSNADLGVSSDAERTQLISYLQGMDAYGKPAEKRSWLLGDLLHSRPAFVSYGPVTESNEGTCGDNANKNMLYVGGNDGMLHAIRDCDGGEEWAFIPPNMLTSLKEIPGEIHTYGVDATPSVYVYDANKDGKIDVSKDKVILLFGMRRGGGAAGDGSAAAKGAYIALDVTNPVDPKYLGSIGSNTLTEMGESWSEPRIIKIKIGGEEKIAAFIIGGYDNVNEDSRYGATQKFRGDGKVSLTDSGSGSVTSSGSSTQQNPKGGAIYLVELATIDNKDNKGVPNFANLGRLLWSVVPGSKNYGTNPATDKLEYSLTGEVALLDTAGSGYPDRMYAADLGGNVWRFDIGGSNVNKWSGNKIFSINPATGDTGRKFFFKPSVTVEATSSSSRGLDALIFLGSGDREHPLNTGVIDRMYALRDRGQTDPKIIPVGEDKIVDVTQDLLQDPSATTAAVNSILTDLKNVDKYGWYIKLNERDGEKVLAPATVFNKVAYFTTYTPDKNSSSSASSLPISTGIKTLTVDKGASILPNQQVFIENGSNRMKGIVTDYDSTSGLLTANITSVVGAGTFSAWRVAWGDPCTPNIGTSRLYAVNYATGEAVFNFDRKNDSTAVSNTRAQSGDTALLRSDRSEALGPGIASGVSVVVNPDGKVNANVNSGGVLVPLQLKKGGTIIPLYWRQK
ncbi:pilus assembly protein [Pelotalea chapellei]|uniref:VWFA domain-containing protein n=1 Tax=Pelotalea chapellei TaxID=44671 RepID=A0ABS5U745_9BACT|nr:PilC/PilY family type IV pilus protein [Pelotalea chapellei]MBT1071482.1 hypothetical protein [Pelotalea chapellei]